MITPRMMTRVEHVESTGKWEGFGLLNSEIQVYISFIIKMSVEERGHEGANKINSAQDKQKRLFVNTIVIIRIP
jgi:hypothetical protein